MTMMVGAFLLVQLPGVSHSGVWTWNEEDFGEYPEEKDRNGIALGLKIFDHWTAVYHGHPSYYEDAAASWLQFLESKVREEEVIGYHPPRLLEVAG